MTWSQFMILYIMTQNAENNTMFNLSVSEMDTDRLNLLHRIYNFSETPIKLVGSTTYSSRIGVIENDIIRI